MRRTLFAAAVLAICTFATSALAADEKIFASTGDTVAENNAATEKLVVLLCHPSKVVDKTLFIMAYRHALGFNSTYSEPFPMVVGDIVDIADMNHGDATKVKLVGTLDCGATFWIH